MLFIRSLLGIFFVLVFFPAARCLGQERNDDSLRTFQFRAVELGAADWIHWGDRSSVFSNWTSHSNRLIPVYSFGVSLESVQGENSCYRNAERLTAIYGQMPSDTLNPKADYFDQTDIYHLQKKAWKSGKKNVILMVFDGMDWNTTQAASIYKNKKVLYTEGRGSGLAFLDYKHGKSEFGFCVTSPHNSTTKKDVDVQLVQRQDNDLVGGYSWEFGGKTPWETPGDPSYLIGKRKTIPHPITDSAASAVSLNAGRKTYNASINVGMEGERIETLAHQMQNQGYSIGIVTNVPISHATPACVYSHNVGRSDYQDITRDLLGLPSISHRGNPLPGVDVLIGCGWGEFIADDRANQGGNYVPGNKYISNGDVQKVNHANGGKYVIAHRTAGKAGKLVLTAGTDRAIANQKRFFGFFGATKGHLPFQTADGNYDPTRGKKNVEVYTPEDIFENPTLADMTKSALKLLEKNEKGFYLMVEAGDVDWANHNNNIDDAIGAVLNGEDAFVAITKWVEENSNWDETCLIVTADHGHMMVLDDPSVLTGECQPESDESFVRKLESKRAADEEKRKSDEQRRSGEKRDAELEPSK